MRADSVAEGIAVPQWKSRSCIGENYFQLENTGLKGVDERGLSEDETVLGSDALGRTAGTGSYISLECSA